MDFNNKVHAIVDIFGEEVWITDSIRNTWIIGGLLILFAIFIRFSIKRFDEVPKGLQNFVELIVDAFDSFTRDTMGDENAGFGFWFFGVMVMILLFNLSGLVGLRPPTADLAVTLTFALMTFFAIHYYGITRSKGEYFKGYIDPFAVFLPLNVMSEIATPISLSFRLFGNILGGLIIMGMVYSLFPIWLKVGTPAILHLYFDIFAGVLQSYIFVILSLTFIRQKLPE